MNLSTKTLMEEVRSFGSFGDRRVGILRRATCSNFWNSQPIKFQLRARKNNVSQLKDIENIKTID